MKKTMIFAIILMPLIVLAMLFVGGTIVYRSTYLYVEYIEFVTNEIVLDKSTSDDVTANLQVNVYPKLANNKSVEFRSANESVAVVDSQGRVTSVDFGTTYIYATSKENSTKTATCKVTVTSDRVHRVWVDNEVGLMYKDDRVQLSTQYAPFEAQNASFVYTSSNPSVLSVSAGGELRAKGRGTATITVAVENDSTVKYQFDVEVKLHIEDISTDTTPVVSSKKTFNFPSITFVPAGADERITYTCDRPDIATVNDAGQIVFSRAGTVVISAQAEGFDKILTKTYTSTFGYVSSVSFSTKNAHTFDYEDYLTGYLPLEWSYAPSDADRSSISVSSSDEAVLTVEDGKVKVVGGGSAIVTLTADSGKGTLTAEWFVDIRRKAQSVAFGVADFGYTSLRTVDLGVVYAPSDATETVKYSVSDSTVASVSEGVLTFTIKTLNNKYGKVKVTAYTDSGVSNTITMVYIDASIPRVTLGDATTLEYTLPASNRPAYSFAIIADSDVDFAIEDGASVTLNGAIVTLADKGTTRLGVYLDGASTTDRYLDINVRRNVEKINNISLSAIVDDEIVHTYSQNDEIYSASDTYRIGYTLYPAHTTRTTADISLGDTDVAVLDGDVVRFSRAGVVTVHLSADGVTETVRIESTGGHPDSQTAVTSHVAVRAGESFSIWDEINISPLYAKREYITYTHTGDAVSISDGVVTGECGGNAVITVSIATSASVLTQTMTVAVSESATDVQVVGEQYIYTEEAIVDLAGKFAVLPATANVDNIYTLSTSDTSIARISGEKLEFVSSGRVIVSATLGDVAVARITVEYTGDKAVDEPKVSDIIFSATAPSDDYITAQERISITQMYGPTVVLTSEETEGETFAIEYSVQSDIAHIDDGVLVFTAPGVVTITFSAGSVTKTKTLESTYGYIKTLTIREQYVGDIVCQYSDGEYTMPSDYFIAVPSDYYKAGVTYTSSDNAVFTVAGDTLTFVGGGSATLGLEYVSTTGEQVIPVGVHILHRAKGINVYEGDILTGYVVENLSAGSTLALRYECVPTIDGVALSGYSMTFATDNASVATVASDGVITIRGNGTAVITVTVTNDYDSAVDATASVTIRNDTRYNILTVSAGSTGTDYVIDIADGRVPIVYPIFNAMVSEFGITGNGDSVGVANDGVLTVNAGGTTTVAVTADEATTLTVYVYKEANITLPTALANASANGTTIVTAQTAYSIGATFGPSDALDRKTVVYESSDDSIATVADGVITFTKAQAVEITVRIMYNGTSETYQKFKIRSTLGKAESFEIDYTAWEMLVGETKTFYISNVLPIDFSGTLTATTTNADAHTLTISGRTLTVAGTKGGSGVVTVKFIGSDTHIDISVDVVQLTESIGFRYNDTAVTSVTTFSNTVTLTASVSPTDATDKGVTWSVVNGPASVSNGTVVFSDYGTATVCARACDYDRSGTESTIVIKYIKDIDGFDLIYNTHTLDNEQTVYVEWSVKKVELSIAIQPSDLAGSVYYEYFTATATDGATAIIDTDDGYINVKIPADASATFSTTVTVNYRGKYVKTVTIFRDGISSVEFIDHDDTLDLECGLQRVRVTGNKSYYDGAVQNYYRMPVAVSPASADTSNIVWTVSNGNVTYDQTLVTIDGVTYVYLYFNAITGSSVAEVYADNFSAGTVVVSAMNKLGRTLDTYTFHIVNAVNVWDEAGFINGGNYVVLQKSLGHDDQAEQIALGTYARLDSYSAKNTIYGNGHLINYAARNNDSSAIKSGGVGSSKWAYIYVSLTNAINLEIQGGNYDESRDSYLVEIPDPQRIAYCTLYNMYRAVEAGGGTTASPTTINIKNSMFRTFAHSTINLSNEGCRVVNLTNVIMFDVGQRAIESQSADDVINISGVFDVYNFQNTDSFSKALGGYESYAEKIIEEANNNDMGVTALGETWANVVIIATKQTDVDSAKTKVYYDGVENGVPGVTKLTVVAKIGFGLTSLTKKEYAIWATKKDNTDITWAHEFVEDSSTSAGYRLNETYMISTISKLKRAV